MAAHSAGETTIEATLAAFEQRRGWPALTCDAGEWTYGELLDHIHRTTRALRSCGIGRGAVVALATGSIPETFVLRFACQALGCASAIVYDDLAPPVLGDMLRYLDAAAVVFRADDAGRVLAAVAQHPATTALSLGADPDAVNLAELAAHEPAEPVVVQARRGDLASIRLTGGSTGTPKAIPHTFAAPAPDPEAMRAWQTTQLMCTAIGHLGGQLAEVVLAAGGRVVLQRNAFDAGAVLEAIERERVEFIWMQPAMLHRLLDHPALEITDTSSLRSLMITGGPSTPHRITRALERFGPIITQGYGAYEIGQITLLTPGEHERPELLTTVGRPLSGVRVSIRDAAGVSLNSGVTGAIWVTGTGLMSGYHNDPDGTAAVLHDGWYHTGDLGFLDAEGYLTVVGRSKDVIIGLRDTVHPTQIEHVLHRHPQIQQAVVFGVSTGDYDSTGDNDEHVCAALVPTPPHRPAAHDITDWVRDALGADSVPEIVLVLSEMPVIGSNKPDRDRLRRLAAEHIAQR